MAEKIKIGNGILEQIKHPYYITGVITKKGLFEDLMQMYKEFYEENPYALEWDYEKFIREMLDYYE